MRRWITTATTFTLVAMWSSAMADWPPRCTATGIGRVITNFTATGTGDHVVLSWHAQSFDTDTQFEVWRSIDGGVTFDSCATNQSGQCLTATYTVPADFTLNDYGVKNNFEYSYRILDSEGYEWWYMAAPFQGSLTKPAPPNPGAAPSFTLSDLWTDGASAKMLLHLTLVGAPPHATPWAHSYTVSYYEDSEPTVRTVTAAMRGSVTIALGQHPLPALFPFRNYHIKIRGNGMSANTPYSVEQHVRIMPAPNLYHAAVVAGTSISLQWSGVDWTAGVQYDVLFQNVSPDPLGSSIVVNVGTQRLWNLSGLVEQSVYEIRVRARDPWGNPSPASLGWALQTGTASPTDVTTSPRSLTFQVYPIPFSPLGPPASLTFALPHVGHAELVIYDARGQLVRRVFRGAKSAGTYVMPWDGRDERGNAVASGLYVMQLRAGGNALTRKLVLAR